MYTISIDLWVYGGYGAPGACGKASMRLGKARQKPERLEAQGKQIRCPNNNDYTRHLKKKKERTGGRKTRQEKARDRLQ